MTAATTAKIYEGIFMFNSASITSIGNQYARNHISSIGGVFTLSSCNFSDTSSYFIMNAAL